LAASKTLILSQLRDAGLIRVKAASAPGKNRHLLPGLVWRNLPSICAGWELVLRPPSPLLPLKLHSSCRLRPCRQAGDTAALPCLGPKRIKLLYDKFRVHTVDDLRRATKRGRARCIAASTLIAGASCTL